MKTTILFTISGIASAFYSIILLAAPSLFVEIHGLNSDNTGIIFLRCAGALCLGYVMMGFLGSRLKSEDGIRAITIANLAGWMAVCGVMLLAKFTSQINSLVFVDIAFCALFTILFATKTFAKQRV